MTDIDIDCLIEAGDWPDEDTLLAFAARAVSAVVTEAGCSFVVPQELSLVFTSDEQIRDLNRDYRGKDSPTNVLSFPQSDDPCTDVSGLLGDIILAHETLVREAELAGRLFEHHLIHLIVHGFLHLLGYDHIEDDEADDMERLETGILASLNIADPYGDRPIDELLDQHA